MNFQEIITDLAVPKRKNAVIAAVVVVLVITLKMLYGGDSATFGSNGRYGPIIKGWQLGPMSVEEFVRIAAKNGASSISFQVQHEEDSKSDWFSLNREDGSWVIADESGVFSELFSGTDLSFNDIVDIFEREAEKHFLARVSANTFDELQKKNGSFRLTEFGVSKEDIIGKGNSMSAREFAQAVLNEFGLDELETNGVWYYTTNDNARGWALSVNEYVVIVSDVERANFD
jgi:hypothetical protein